MCALMRINSGSLILVELNDFRDPWLLHGASQQFIYLLIKTVHLSASPKLPCEGGNKRVYVLHKCVKVTKSSYIRLVCDSAQRFMTVSKQKSNFDTNSSIRTLQSDNGDPDSFVLVLDHLPAWRVAPAKRRGCPCLFQPLYKQHEER